MAQSSLEVLVKKVEEIELSEEVFYGQDLSLEKKFLESITETLGKDLQHWEVSYYLSKKSMAICCETFILTKETGKTLLEVVNKNISEHFFSSCGLLKFGWCSNYQLDSRIVRYLIEESPGLDRIKKTQIIEFCWFNCLLLFVRYNENKSLDQVNVCSSLYCRIFCRS